MSERKGDWMQVASGRSFWPFDPRPEEVHLHDIAHGLSMLCRFGGHTQQFYSVAEHSVWCSQIVPPEHALQALMHDATEAYCVDIPRPLKRGLSNYAEIEGNIWEAVCERFGLVRDLHESVKRADNAMCLAEARQIMSRPEIDWSATGEAADIKVACWLPEEARRRFLMRFHELTAITHRGWVITPIAIGFDFQHPDYDWKNEIDWRHGHADTIEGARIEIDSLLAEDAEWTEAAGILKSGLQDPSRRLPALWRQIMATDSNATSIGQNERQRTLALQVAARDTTKDSRTVLADAEKFRAFLAAEGLPGDADQPDLP